MFLRTCPQPRLDWAGRAVFAALIRFLPRRLRMGRPVTPGTVLRWRQRLVSPPHHRARDQLRKIPPARAPRVTSTAVPARTVFAGPALKNRGTPDRYIRSPDQRCVMCPHRPPAPAERPDHDAARIVAFHPEQGWSLLCNGVIVFDDRGEILPGGRVVPPPPNPHPAARRGMRNVRGRSISRRVAVEDVTVAAAPFARVARPYQPRYRRRQLATGQPPV